MKANLKALKQDNRAVSPVVATLMLVLVAAASAVGLSVFLNGFQDDAQKNVSSDVGGTCLTIGGSSTVFEFSKVAIELFEASPGGCHVELNSGGSGAGVIAAGTCAIDIGSASRIIKQTEFNTYPDCDGDGNKDFGRELVVTTIGYDAVVNAVKSGDCAADADISLDTLTNLWFVNSGRGTYSSRPFPLDPVTAATPGPFTFLDVFGGTCPATVIELVSRTDDGGTMEVFCDFLLQKEVCVDSRLTEGDHPNVTFTGLGGNQDAQAYIASASTDTVFGYSSVGGILGDATLDYTLVEGVDGGDSGNVLDGSYAGSRPLNYVTVGEPQGTAKVYLDFVLMPRNNQVINTAADFITLYP